MIRYKVLNACIINCLCARLCYIYVLHTTSRRNTRANRYTMKIFCWYLPGRLDKTNTECFLIYIAIVNKIVLQWEWTMFYITIEKYFIHIHIILCLLHTTFFEVAILKKLFYACQHYSFFNE